MLAAVNEHLAVAGFSITREEALMLAERRVESLAETERVEFGPPAIEAIAEAGASSPFLMREDAAHEIPCDIDYQLSEPVDPQLLGLDYIEAWLAQLLAETRWIAQFDAASCVNVLERTCPDFKGLRVNLYDLLIPHEDELARIASRAAGT